MNASITANGPMSDTEEQSSSSKCGEPKMLINNNVDDHQENDYQTNLTKQFSENGKHGAYKNKLFPLKTNYLRVLFIIIT